MRLWAGALFAGSVAWEALALLLVGSRRTCVQTRAAVQVQVFGATGAGGQPMTSAAGAIRVTL